MKLAHIKHSRAALASTGLWVIASEAVAQKQTTTNTTGTTSNAADCVKADCAISTPQDPTMLVAIGIFGVGLVAGAFLGRMSAGRKT